jgi:Putative zinc-finger
VTTGRSEWHVAEVDLIGYVDGALGTVPAASVDTHLLRCADCRESLGRVAGGTREQAWRRLADTIDRPSSSVLDRLTLGHVTARSAVATPAMVRAALVAVALVGLVPLLLVALAEDVAPLAILILAPLAPVTAVALAYREWADPAGEITLATPAAGLRLVAMRALVVSVATVVLTVSVLLVLDAWVDVPTGLAFAWCLPGLALAALVLLAGTTRLDPLTVAVTLSGGWAAVLVFSGVTGRRGLRYEALLDVLAASAFQFAALAVAVAALALTAARRDAVTYRRTA